MSSLVIKTRTQKKLNLQEIQDLKSGLENFFGKSWEFEVDYFDLEEPTDSKKSTVKSKETKPTKNLKIQEISQKIKEFWEKEGLKNQNYISTQEEIDSLIF